MHTAEQLSVSQFAIEVNGRRASREEVFPPRWDASDRLGVIIDRPLGAIGASHLIQLAITGFYDDLRPRMQEIDVYPETYLFHVGGRHGDFSPFDFYPPHKEVFVDDAPGAILRALQAYAITRLALPHDHRAQPVPIPDEAVTRAGARLRLSGAFLYAPTGRVVDADVTIAGVDPATESNPAYALDVDSVIAMIGEQPDLVEQAYLDRVIERASEVPPRARAELIALRQGALREGCMTESYRRIDGDQALARLAPVCQLSR
jgi:hypothetical protein